MNSIDIAEMSKGTLAPDVDEYVLLKEMSHRINNEYAGVINTIWLRASRSPSVEVRTALTDVVTLLMQDVHRVMTFPVDGRPIEICTYLQRLRGALRAARLKDRNIKLLFVESEPQSAATKAEVRWNKA